MWKLGTFLTLCSLPIFAGLSERVEEIEKKMSDVGKINAEGNFSAEMRSAKPEVKGEKWFTHSEILYWDTKIGGTEYALTTAQPVTPPTTPIKGSVKSNSFGWNWGGRAGFGLNLPHDGWDLFVNFTYYQNHDSSSSSKALPSFLVSQVGFFGGAFEQAKSTFDLTYLNIDFELGRKFFISQYLCVKPYMGIKGTRMLQEHKVKLNFSTLQLNGANIGEYYRVYNRCDFNGIGPRIGFEGNWFLGYGYRLIHEVSASLLYCYFDVVDKEKSSPNTSDINANIRLKGKIGRFIPFAQMFLGLGWGDYFNDKKHYLTLKMGYEVLYFWRDNQCLSPEDWSFSPGQMSTRLSYKRFAEDLSFYGITFRARLDF